MDDYIVSGADGRVLAIGTWIQAEPGPDFGFSDLQQAQFSQNAFSDEPQFAYESVGVRRFTFPLFLASNGAFSGGLTGLETLIRNLARPGAVIDLKPDGVATADMIRFDVLTGRWKPDYNLRVNQLARRMGALELDVKPVGYMPTLITLASTASVGLPGVLTIPNASIVGDWPGQAELMVTPTVGPTQYGPGSWYPDMLAWSLSARASHVAFWPAASLVSYVVASAASMIGDFAAPASQAWQFVNGGGAPIWASYNFYQPLLGVRFQSGSGPFLNGRFRVFAWMNLTPSHNGAAVFSVDLAPEFGGSAPAALASAQPIATAANAIASGTPGGFGAQPSRGYTLIDLGELNASPSRAYATPEALRVWGALPSGVGGVSTELYNIAGLYLLPLDGPAGVLPRGQAQPTISNPIQVTTFDLDARTGRKEGLSSASGPAIIDLSAQYRGGMPYVGGSTLQLDLLGGHRKTASGATTPVIYGSRGYAAVSLRYRPRFLFLKGV